MSNQITLTESKFLITEGMDDFRIPSIFEWNNDSDWWDLLPKFEYDDLFINSKVQSDEFDTWQSKANKNHSLNYIKSTFESNSWKEENYCFDFDNKIIKNWAKSEKQVLSNGNGCILRPSYMNSWLSNQSCFSESEFYDQCDKLNKTRNVFQNSDFNNAFRDNDLISLNNRSYSGYRVTDYINDAITNGTISLKTKPGRPKHTYDTSFETITWFFKKYINNLQSLIEGNYSKKRSDTFRFTVFSYLKKLPIKLREICCSVSDPKSKWFDIYLDAFLSPFINWFIPFFKDSESDSSKLQLFLHFICICFPEDKWNQVLKRISLEGSIEESDLNQIRIGLQLRKGKSKKDISSFIASNPCFFNLMFKNYNNIT